MGVIDLSTFRDDVGESDPVCVRGGGTRGEVGGDDAGAPADIKEGDSEEVIAKKKKSLKKRKKHLLLSTPSPVSPHCCLRFKKGEQGEKKRSFCRVRREKQ